MIEKYMFIIDSFEVKVLTLEEVTDVLFRSLRTIYYSGVNNTAVVNGGV